MGLLLDILSSKKISPAAEARAKILREKLQILNYRDH
jgi:hypothetical protein